MPPCTLRFSPGAPVFYLVGRKFIGANNGYSKYVWNRLIRIGSTELYERVYLLTIHVDDVVTTAFIRALEAYIRRKVEIFIENPPSMYNIPIKGHFRRFMYLNKYLHTKLFAQLLQETFYRFVSIPNIWGGEKANILIVRLCLMEGWQDGWYSQVVQQRGSEFRNYFRNFTLVNG